MPKSTLSRRENLVGYLFISPWLIGFCIFTIGPIIASLVLSFTYYDVINPPTWIGLKNYITMVGDELVKISLYNTVYITLFGVPLNITIALIIALLLNKDMKGVNIYRTLYYLPSIVPVVAASIMWLWLLNPSFGVVNGILAKLRLPTPGWTASITWSKPTILIIRAWGTGSLMVIYLAGLKGIPQQLYEAALLDGANSWQLFRYITFPMLTPVIFLTSITETINNLQVFTQAFIMTQGCPANSTLFYVYHLYNNAFVYFKMGYASALAWGLFVITLIITLIQFKLSGKWVYYEAEPGR